MKYNNGYTVLYFLNFVACLKWGLHQKWLVKDDICTKHNTYSITHIPEYFQNKTWISLISNVSSTLALFDLDFQSFLCGSNQIFKCEGSRAVFQTTAALWSWSGPNWNMVCFVCSVKARLAIVWTFGPNSGSETIKHMKKSKQRKGTWKKDRGRV